MNYYKTKPFPKYKGTDIATVKCQRCGRIITRTIESLRKTLKRRTRVMCTDCPRNMVDKNYHFIEQIYKVKKLSKSVT